VLAKAAQQFLQDKVAVAAPGDFAQALFDLGATVCTPRNPNCGVCPWAGHCLAQAQGIAASLPARAPKKVRPHRTGTAYVLLDGTDNVFLRRRPPSGLLGGMLEVPDTPPVKAEWQDAGTIDHVFTHFSLTLTVLVARVKNLPAGGEIAPAKNAGLPSVMRKALDAGRRALKDSE
jgi:A/G-specific adenine glycosylase